jgi:hypothetical protein
MLGATVAIAAGGVTSGVIAKKRYGDLETQLQGQHGASYQATWDAGQKGIKDAALAADILYGTAAVAAGITVWLFVRSVPPSSPTVSLAAGSHGAAVSLSGSF